MDRMLIYGIGGVAFARIETSQSAASAFSETKTNVGWTMTPVDYALTYQFVVGAVPLLRLRSEHYDASGDFTGRDQNVKLNTVGVNLSYKF